MKATELMIGDWVQIKGHLDYDKVREIAFDNSMQMYISFACSATLFRAYDFDPIPLTAEILEKNGFRKGSYIGGYYYPLFTFRVIPTTRDMDSYFDKVEMIEDVVFYHCRYVHELQHALRLCGLNDLADNLKV